MDESWEGEHATKRAKTHAIENIRSGERTPQDAYEREGKRAGVRAQYTVLRASTLRRVRTRGRACEIITKRV